MADLVAMLNERHLNAQVTLRQTVHDAADRTERTNQAATESECGQSRDDQSPPTAKAPLHRTVNDAADRPGRTTRAATESEGGQPRDEQSRQSARGDPDG